MFLKVVNLNVDFINFVIQFLGFFSWENKELFF